MWFHLAEVSTSKDGRGPQLQVAAVAVEAVGIYSGKSFWTPPDLFFSHGDFVVEGIPLGTGPSLWAPSWQW